MLRKNKEKSEFSIDLSKNPALGKSSPYVIDLKKIIEESTKAELTPKTTKKKVEVARLSELTFFSFLFSLAKFFKKIICFFRAKIVFFINFLVVKIRDLGNFLLRLIKFFEFSLVDYKKILRFGLLAFVFILPLQTFSYYESLKKAEAGIMNKAKNAYANLLVGGTSLANADFKSAAENFDRAAESFSQAQNELLKINFIIANLLKVIPEKGEQFEIGEDLFFVGEKISWAGEKVLSGLTVLAEKDDEKTLTKKIKIFSDHLVVALPEITQAAERLAKVNVQAIPEDKREIFKKLKESLPGLARNLKNLISVSDFLVKFLGDEMPKRYLVVFQNSGELRPTGGFMGSIALIDFDQGQIKNMEIPGGGPYDFQGSLREKVISPEPMRLINPHWQLQDANWFPDFPTSAKKIKWFYEKSGGPTVDGVIAINSDFVVELLGVVGPIEMPDYNKVLNQKNFISEIQKAVEIEYDKKENKPKQIIADLAPKLIEKILNSEPEQLNKILGILVKGLGEKNVLLYSVFPEVEHQILTFQWGGDVRKIDEGTDYLLVSHANISGGKTDSVIDEEINLNISFSDDGYIKNKVTVRKVHQGIKGELFTGARNVGYLRVYVPAGSTLLAAEGFEAPPEHLFEKPEDGYRPDLDLKNIEGKVLIDAASGTRITEEFGKTVFGNWVQVDPGEEVIVSFEYLLPFKLVGQEAEKNWWTSFREKFGQKQKEKIFYKLLVQKQPGARANFRSQIYFPDNWQPVFQYGNMKILPQMVMVDNQLNLDRFYFVGFEQR